MPAPYINSLVKKTGKSKEEFEKYWKEAKKIATDEYGHIEKTDSDKFYGTIVKIFKNKINKHMGLNEAIHRNNFERLLENLTGS